MDPKLHPRTLCKSLWYVRLGTFEGVMRLNWTTGDIDYMADCHGDSYDVLPAGDIVYAASHSHDCSNIGGFPDVSYHYHNAVAYTNAATGTVKENSAAGYKSYAGQNATTNLNFYPDFTPGKISGAIQATWIVEDNDKYVVYDGEFLTSPVRTAVRTRWPPRWTVRSPRRPDRRRTISPPSS